MVKQKYIMTLKKQLCVSLYMYQTLMIPVKRNSISFNQHKTSEISFYLKSSVLIQKKKKITLLLCRMIEGMECSFKHLSSEETGTRYFMS